ncbi:unnamed protein product [Urochloa decumbens]|uniref:Uncharacterized protein n=2 Tax=Poaceae TaxID=4479 RepID=A0ABC8WU75_9POAL
MLLRLKVVGVHSAVLPGGYDHGGAGACAAAPRQRSRSPPASRAARRRRKVAVTMSLKEEPESSRSGFAGGGPSWDPGLEIEVPFEQRPVINRVVQFRTILSGNESVAHVAAGVDWASSSVQVNEYSALKDSVLYSWAELSPGSFFLRLGGLWMITFTVLAAPIAAASFNPGKDPLKFVLAAGIGTLLLVSLVVLRIYLGWSYVGDRLLSAVVPYEETGWYDGQMWVKPPEVLARDRLLGSYKVKPVINLLKQTLVGTGALLVGAVSLFAFAAPVEGFLQSLNQPPSAASSKPSLRCHHVHVEHVYTFITQTLFHACACVTLRRREELLRLPVEVMQDDDLAAAAAEAADGRPVYCRDRYYRALAGGQYCKWDDLLN